MKIRLLVVCTSALWACSKDSAGDGSGGDTGTHYADVDGDGFQAPLDCDDENAEIHPDAVEVCDDQDNDCDGDVDEADAQDAATWYLDSDGDGYGDPSETVLSCAQPSNAVDNADDCNDASDAVFPGAEELCNDEDDDCDGEVDEDAVDMTAWYLDEDGDGYGTTVSETWSCDPLSGMVNVGGDCKDRDVEINPGVAEICDGIDNDCDEGTSEDGTVSLLHETGRDDVTAELTGTSSAPAAYTLENGVLNFCDGTHYVNLELKGNAGLRSQNQDPTLAILDGAGQSWVVHSEDSKNRVEITDLGIQGGFGDWIDSLEVSAGGGIYCGGLSGTTPGSQEMSLENVILTGNEAEYGGGLFTAFCDMSLNNVEISGNVADVVAGGMYLVHGDHRIANTDILDNVAGEVAGGAAIVGQTLTSDDVTATLDEVIVSGNSALEFVSGIGFVSGTFSWQGTQGTAGSGVHSNSTTNDGAGFYLSNVIFKSKGIDFGTSANGDDNDPIDVVHVVSDGQAEYWAGDDMGFACNSTRCGNLTSASLGGDVSDGLTDSKALLGNVVLSSSTATLMDWEMDFSETSEEGCTVDFYLMGSASAPGTGSTTWDVEWSRQDVAVESADTTATGTVGVALEKGRYYMLATWSQCELDVGVDVSAPSTAAGWGTGIGYAAELIVNQNSLNASTFETTEYYDAYGPLIALDLDYTEL